MSHYTLTDVVSVGHAEQKVTLQKIPGFLGRMLREKQETLKFWSAETHWFDLRTGEPAPRSLQARIRSLLAKWDIERDALRAISS